MSVELKTQILVGAASSGSGKTTFTLGLLRALRNRGISVQPYKCGPDYIDTQYHSLAAGRDSVNLDLFMGGREHVKEVYSRYGNDAQVAVVEGVMGLFDGYHKMEGSAAQIAQTLDIPVLLVVNAKSCAYSVAATVYGFKNFCPDVKIAGIVFNMVGSPSHYAILKDACAELDIPVLGYLPKNAAVEIPSRHLGLSLDSDYLFDDFAQKVAALVEEYVDIDALLEIFKVEELCAVEESANEAGTEVIAVAKDEAFNFIYRENLHALGKLGQVEFFSPINDNHLPDRTSLLYLPGGYPELYLEQLEANSTLRSSIKEYIEAGGKAVAECGGMMYLCNAIRNEEGKPFSMCRVLPQEATMEGKRLHIGYRQFEYAGKQVRGHEFHYSKVLEPKAAGQAAGEAVGQAAGEDSKIAAADAAKLQSAAQLYTARGAKTSTPLYRYKNLIAGYTHLYWGNMNILELFEEK